MILSLVVILVLLAVGTGLALFEKFGGSPT